MKLTARSLKNRRSNIPRIFNVTLELMTAVTCSFRVKARTPEKAIEKALSRDWDDYENEGPDSDGPTYCIEITDEDGTAYEIPPDYTQAAVMAAETQTTNLERSSMDYAQQIVDAGDNLAFAVKEEMALEDNRHNVKMAAVTRIMQSGDNPLTNKPHSFSSAEALVNSDAEYAEYLGRIREAAARRIRARAQYDSAVASAHLARGVA